MIARVDNKLQRREYVDGFLSAMMSAGKPLEGYKAAPEPKDAFAYIAGEQIIGISKAEEASSRQPASPLTSREESRGRSTLPGIFSYRSWRGIRSPRAIGSHPRSPLL